MKDLLTHALDELKSFNPESETVKEIEEAILFRDEHPERYARKVLKDRGYQVENLWHIDDVLQNYECDDETAMIILERALTNDRTMEEVFYVIDYEVERENLNLRHHG